MLKTHQALTEAERCLQCFDAPCRAACPVHIDIRAFIAMIRSGNVTGAAEKVRSANALSNTCGKVCPEEVFCQSVCIRMKQDAPVAIRELHSYVTQKEKDHALASPVMRAPTRKKIAVIGGGPAGLSCAFELSKMGHGVDVYNSGPPGGVPRNSIPSFRLAEAELESDIELLSRYFTIHDVVVDRAAFGALRARHDATFLAVGLGVDRPLGVPGENLPGVIPALEFLQRAKRRPDSLALGFRLIVIGGGNVSLDAAATARRLGVDDVTLIYRRGEREMRVWKSELDEARRLGVRFQYLTSPVEVLGKDRVEGLRCRFTRLSAEQDTSGRPVPREVAGSDFTLIADTVVTAIGQQLRADWLSAFKRTAGGFLAVDDEFSTSEPGVFAGGDVIHGEGTIVHSVAHGKQAAWFIHERLTRGRR